MKIIQCEKLLKVLVFLSVPATNGSGYNSRARKRKLKTFDSQIELIHYLKLIDHEFHHDRTKTSLKFLSDIKEIEGFDPGSE